MLEELLLMSPTWNFICSKEIPLGPRATMSEVIINYLISFVLHPQWYKLDELFEQERNVRTAMTNRAGLLALMLHQTIQHDPLTTDLRSNKDR